MSKKLYISLCAIVLGCASLLVLVAYQISIIISKNIALNTARKDLLSIEQELASARETWEIVSSDDHHNLYARKKGYGIPGEVEYISR